MAKRYSPTNLEKKIACITLDFEKDYDGLTDHFNILEKSEEKILKLGKLFHALRIPISAFIRTDLLDQYEDSLPLIKALSSDFHCHSHSHDLAGSASADEIRNSKKCFEKHFGYTPLGYRTPLGILRRGDIKLIKKYGYKFSASIFPSWRPGVFNNMFAPTKPFYHQNGLLEIPFSVVPRVRYIISLSYLKLLGFNNFLIAKTLFGLPDLIVFDSHLHDFIFDAESFENQPRLMRILGRRNHSLGITYFKHFIALLKQDGYTFYTMTELYRELEEGAQKQ